ncbi:MAG: hypothetical protein DI539_31200 [Flavobacterium psychrophilum]|nr:MAG: hypothetical protein DI539_31200 [Flavobacterium psychrophilum]
MVICKPIIRRNAQVGDWIVGTGSKNVRQADGGNKDLSGKLVYAMKVTQKMTMVEYDSFCRESLPDKIPFNDLVDWRREVGDCIYDFTNANNPVIREGVHDENNCDRDLSGTNALLSSHFYYFGDNVVDLPAYLLPIVMQTQGHKVTESADIIKKFESWISQFPLNKIDGAPQQKHMFLKDCSVKNDSKLMKKDKPGGC